MNSERLRRYVLDELKFDPRIDASSVAVSVEKRIVSLTGHVHSVADKAAVVDAVKRLKGVRGIVVDMDVRPTEQFRIEDEEIAVSAAAVLAWHPVAPKDAVKVTVENGCLTLSGAVDWNFQKAAIEDDLRKLAGITGIRNEIVLRRTTQEVDIKQSIKEAMRRLADVHSANVNVDVDGEGHVKLKGRVVGWQARNAVEDAAWMVAGVRDVDNRVRVS